MTRPDWLIDMPADEYHAATKRNEYTTSHRLSLFRRCPALYHKHITGEIVEGDTDAFMLGRATHTLILEGREKFDAEYIVDAGPVNPKTGKPYGRVTKAWQEWAAERTKPVVTPEDFALIEKMDKTVHEHLIAADILSSGICEGTIRTSWLGEPVQARIDWFDPDRAILADLKTCDDMDKFGFNIRDYDYVRQMAFYAKCLELAGYDRRPTVYLVAVEKKEPYRASVCEILPGTIYAGTYDPAYGQHGAGNETSLKELLECRAADRWPTRFEDIVKI